MSLQSPLTPLPDPYLSFNGTTYRFLSDCGIFSNCTQSATPIQTAINFFAQNSATIPANDRAIFVDGGTYRENVSINGLSNFSLRGSANGFLSVIDGSVTIANSVGINLSAFNVTTGVTVSKAQNVAVTSVTTNQVTVSQSQNVTVSNSQVATKDAVKPAIKVEASEKVHVENVNTDSSIRVDNSANVSVVDSGGNNTLHLLANNVSELDLFSSGDLTLSGDSRVTSPSGEVNLRADGILTMEAGSVIDTSANRLGDGGAVNLIAGQATNFYGTILARGGELGGNGGNVEVSGAQLDYRGSVDLRAPSGKTGTLLLDPGDYTVASSGGDITGATLGTQLATANVTIQTSAAGGNLYFNDNVTWSSANTLTGKAHNDVIVANGVTLSHTSGSGSLVLRADSDADNSGTVTFNGVGAQINFAGSSGDVTLFYNPTSYATPTDFSANVTVDTGTFIAYMLVNTLTNLQDITTNLSGDYALGKDIDASATSGWNAGAGFVPIGDLINPFEGKFNGNNFAISNLFIDRDTTDSVGLFGVTCSCVTIENLSLTNVDITGQNGVGGLVGDNEGTINNVYVSGNVTGFDEVGLLLGTNFGGTVTNSHTSGTVVGTEAATGGLIGFDETGTISLSYSTANVSGVDYVGGLIGAILSSTLAKTYNVGNVSGNEAVGGLVGYNIDGQINQSYNTGNVDGVAIVGGLVGINFFGGAITNSYNIGSVSGDTIVGGLVGLNLFWGSISNSYNAGNVTGITNSGGLIGADLGGLVSNSFWDIQTSNQETSAGGTALTTAQMKTQTTFSGAGWDFTTTWNICDGATYPFLLAIPQFILCPLPAPAVVSEPILPGLNPTLLTLSNGNQVSLPPGIGDSASLMDVSCVSLPGALPPGLACVSAINLNVYSGGIALSFLPAPATITFAIPASLLGTTIRILHWNGTGWDTILATTATDGTISFQTNLTGIFVLAAG